MKQKREILRRLQGCCRDALRTVREQVPERRLLVGVSGGVDSVVLLDALQDAAAREGWELFAAHLDHGWRGEESARDAEFVCELCHARGIHCETAKLKPGAAPPNQGGREAVARRKRYAFFARAAKRLRCRALAVAHHGDDQAETVLMNLLRGSGSGGLGGMEPVSLREGLWILRPLLDVSRAEIEAYARQRGLEWREDSGNQDASLLRNRIRAQLLPLLERDYNPKVRDALIRLARIMRIEDEWAETEARRRYERLGAHTKNSKPPRKITRAFFSRHPEAIVRRILRLWLADLRPGEFPPPLNAVENLLDFIRHAENQSLLHSIDSLIFRKTRTHIALVSDKPGVRLRRKS
ncbi:tRNA lysidine(34) synthetase TilS [Candidatus Sumerlaeota bacterium]|nr:tRNA lysidine(34) synthetase TilS [Candidatus Sumerlaeota bacterium]